MEGYKIPAIEIGRICIKVKGRESGKKCVIVDIIDKSFVLITGPQTLTGIKRRRVNVQHIQTTEKSVKIKRGSSDKDVLTALETDEKLEDMKGKIVLEV
jgi:large subunit ribosomal protein L14e